MLHEQHLQRQSGGWDVRSCFNFTFLIASCTATCFTVFLRHSFGGDALGFRAVGAVVIMIVCMGAHPESTGMAQFFGLWWIALIIQRIGHFAQRFKGVYLHSRFDGIPWIATLCPFAMPYETAKVLEIILCAVLGTMLQSHDAALGGFVWCGAIGLTVKGIIENSVDRRQVSRMRDAEIEQRAMLERWRGGSW